MTRIATTYVIMLVVGVLLILGGVLLGGSRRGARRAAAGDRACPNPDCRSRNHAEARFCAHCGRALDE